MNFSLEILQRMIELDLVGMKAIRLARCQLDQTKGRQLWASWGQASQEGGVQKRSERNSGDSSIYEEFRIMEIMIGPRM